MRAFLDRRRERERRELRELHARAASDADRIVEMIATTFRPTRIVQWGSVLHPAHFRRYSDIDIATEGIVEASTYFRMLDEVEKLTTFRVDLVQLEKIEPEFRELILSKGKIVYGS